MQNKNSGIIQWLKNISSSEKRWINNGVELKAFLPQLLPISEAFDSKKTN